MNKGIPTGTKIKAKVQKKWIAAEVLSHDVAEGWIELKSKGYEQYVLNTKIHQNHLKIPEIVEEKPVKPKRVRKSRKKRVKK